MSYKTRFKSLFKWWIILPNCLYTTLYIKPCSFQLVAWQLSLYLQRLYQLSHPTWKYPKHTSNRHHVPCRINSGFPKVLNFVWQAYQHQSYFCQTQTMHERHEVPAEFCFYLDTICFIHYIEHVQYKFYPRRSMLKNHSISNMCLSIQLERAA